jgi:small conductance mechanosensitive channel
MQPSHREGLDTIVVHAWRLVPSTLQTLLAKGLRVVLIALAARFILRAVPRLERLVVQHMTARTAARAAAGLRASDSLSHESKHAATVVRVVGSIARAAVGGVAVVTLLAELGVDIAPLLAGAGIAGVAIGFGAQAVVKDFFNGFFILLEGQFNVGDEVTINTVRGHIEEMTMRVTVLRDLAGSAHYFPNGSITTVVNHQAGWSRATVPLTTPLHVPAAEVRRLLDAVVREASEDETLKRKAHGPATVEGPTEVTAQGVSWRLVAPMRAGYVEAGRAALVAALQRRLKTGAAGAIDWAESVKDG